MNKIISLMKYLNELTFLFLCMTLALAVSSSTSSYLKIDIIEAINMHCKLNNEFYCNPYAIVQFKFSSETRSTKRIECTKNPKWDSAFAFEPEFCQETVSINFYQYLTPHDKAFLGDSISDLDHFEKGEVSPGYLGRIILQLDKLPFGMIDDWFMIETPIDNTRIMFPSCLHLRISYTSTTCNESSAGSLYQLDSFIRKDNNEKKKKDFAPTNFLPMCKHDFAMIYKTKFSRLDKEGGLIKVNELSTLDKDDKADKCKMDSNQDYGFEHKDSSLTSVEEALAYKIVKRTTGEVINYQEFKNNFNSEKNYKNNIKSYKEFFDKECLKALKLTIERINKILQNDAENFPSKTTNPYLSPNVTQMDYPLMLNNKIMRNVYNDTLSQFYALEDVKNLDHMDEDTYLQTMNKMVEVMKEIKAEKKIDSTLFYEKNKVMLTNQGRVHEKEERFFRVYALYKWNGGKFEYDEIKREFMLRRKYFNCYEIVKIMPTNIIFQFIEDLCPDNYVCVDPNGIVIKSKGMNPKNVFKTDIEKNGINFFVNMQNNKLFENSATKLRFKASKSSKSGNNNNNSSGEVNKSTQSKDKKTNIENNEEENEKKTNSDVTDFTELLKMEEDVDVDIDTTLLSTKRDDNNTYMNKFDTLFIQRRLRIKKKKETIINKVFNNVPLIGETLALANFDTLHDKLDSKLISRETNLVKKYLLVYNSNIPFVDKAANVLINLVLCNTDKNKLRFVINELLEGLCYGDDRSIKIFEEIVRTVIIDSLLNTPYFYFDELHAKVNLVKTLNKPFCYTTITKIRFVESMLMLDILKERITYIIWNNDTNKKIALKIYETELSIPVTLPNNKRLFAYANNRAFDNAKEVNQNYLKELQRLENVGRGIGIGEIKNGFKFKSFDTLDTLDTVEKKKSNKKSEEEIEGKINSVRKQLDDELDVRENDTGLNFKEINKENSNSKIKSNEFNEEDLMNEFDNINNTNGELEKMHFKEKEEFQQILTTPLNAEKSKKMSLPKFKSINDNDNNNYNSEDLFSLSESNSVSNSNANSISDTESSDEFAALSLNQYNNPKIYETHDQPGASILTAENNGPSNQDLMNKIMKDPSTRKIIEDSRKNINSKVVFPKEIHSTFEVNRRGTKQVTVNADNPTKLLILDKLLDEKTYNDMMNQEENNKLNDQTGLFNVLKNIQNKKCSYNFLCIETGAIYGPFDNLRPRNITMMTSHRENVQVIIKPVIVINNTMTTSHLPNANLTGLFESEDCDLLKMSSIANDSTNKYAENIRFKQLVDKSAKLAKLKRKFYRKVESGNDILATEIFKQGLNVIILAREKGYKKLYERTFNTNVDAIESDAMACVLRDAGYDKIIIITGVGKWMGALTPRLLKEIKQVGGPDLNQLTSIDSEDNSMADHAFILIGRRGLCRYNGVFRVKNYDVSRDMKKYFPDISSDPNDCYFENLAFENEKLKHSKIEFFHLVDSRLTLDLNNDNRFSYTAPIITGVTPFTAPLNGGVCVTITGKNFGMSSLGIKEVLVRGVVCRDVILVSQSRITCTTGSSTIMGPGVGNVQVKLNSGLSSPSNTCSMFKYTSEVALLPTNPEPLFDRNADTMIIAPLKPLIPLIPMRAFSTPVIPVATHIRKIIPLHSFKETNSYDEHGNPDLEDIKKSLDRKLYQTTDPNVQKIDNLVTDNFNQLLSNTAANKFETPRDGFRKARFAKLKMQLK